MAISFPLVADYTGEISIRFKKIATEIIII